MLQLGGRFFEEYRRNVSSAHRGVARGASASAKALGGNKRKEGGGGSQNCSAQEGATQIQKVTETSGFQFRGGATRSASPGAV